MPRRSKYTGDDPEVLEHRRALQQDAREARQAAAEEKIARSLAITAFARISDTQPPSLLMPVGYACPSFPVTEMWGQAVLEMCSDYPKEVLPIIRDDNGREFIMPGALQGTRIYHRPGYPIFVGDVNNLSHISHREFVRESFADRVRVDEGINDGEKVKIELQLCRQYGFDLPRKMIGVDIVPKARDYSTPNVCNFETGFEQKNFIFICRDMGTKQYQADLASATSDPNVAATFTNSGASICNWADPEFDFQLAMHLSVMRPAEGNRPADYYIFSTCENRDRVALDGHYNHPFYGTFFSSEFVAHCFHNGWQGVNYAKTRWQYVEDLDNENELRMVIRNSEAQPGIKRSYSGIGKSALDIGKPFTLAEGDMFAGRMKRKTEEMNRAQFARVANSISLPLGCSLLVERFSVPADEFPNGIDREKMCYYRLSLVRSSSYLRAAA